MAVKEKKTEAAAAAAPKAAAVPKKPAAAPPKEDALTRLHRSELALLQPLYDAAYASKAGIRQRYGNLIKAHKKALKRADRIVANREAEAAKKR